MADPFGSPALRTQSIVALLLAWAAGFVDAVGWRLLAGVYPAHMTGNTAAMSIRVSDGELREALDRFYPITTFVLGIAIGAALAVAARRRGWRSKLAAPFALETVLLVLFCALGAGKAPWGVLGHDDSMFFLLAALATIAMGIQTVSLSDVGGTPVRTTFLTGMLTNLAEELVDIAVETNASRRPPDVPSPSRARAILFGGLWFAFWLGAAVGGLASLRWGPVASLFPTGVVAAVATFDFARAQRGESRTADEERILRLRRRD